MVIFCRYCGHLFQVSLISLNFANSASLDRKGKRIWVSDCGERWYCSIWLRKKKVNAVAFCCPGLCDSTCQVILVGVVVTVCDDLPHFVIVCTQHATGRCGSHSTRTPLSSQAEVCLPSCFTFREHNTPWSPVRQRDSNSRSKSANTRISWRDVYLLLCLQTWTGKVSDTDS